MRYCAQFARVAEFNVASRVSYPESQLNPCIAGLGSSNFRQLPCFLGVRWRLEGQEGGGDPAAARLSLLDIAHHLGLKANGDGLGEGHLVRNVERDLKGGLGREVRVGVDGDPGGAQIVEIRVDLVILFAGADRQRELDRGARASAAIDSGRFLTTAQAGGPFHKTKRFKTPRVAGPRPGCKAV